ncbi:hypothetical protein HU200_040989 [Digitaria exilis]|uniref:Uncharacterized protein n=1 Tax=Digitaria exilis TaxID=1010633 RepID=A0A835EJJ7_9POAL|nr:hypothetical protein HU200_040989 [Digitaria exilis]
MVNLKTLFHRKSKIHHIFNIYNILGTPNEETWPGVSSTCLSLLSPSSFLSGRRHAMVRACRVPARGLTAREADRHRRSGPISARGISLGSAWECCRRAGVRTGA